MEASSGEDGHAVRIANDGRQGLAMIHQRYPDVVLLDVEMPELTGPQMAYAVFLHDVGAECIPIVLLSGVLDLKDVAAAVGTPYYLSKPYTLDGVERLVHRALSERRPPHPRPVGRV